MSATLFPAVRLRLTFFLFFFSLAGAFGQGFAGVLTGQNDNARTGQNLSETVLTQQNVEAASFGKVLSYPVDGQIYAQPLYVPNVSIPNVGTRNVVYVATENDSVYAFDADGLNSNPLWHVSFSNFPNGISPVNCVKSGLSCNVYPVDGITGTPVIDPTTNTMYLVSHTLEKGTYFVRLHALDITAGAEKFGGPVALHATVNGTGAGSVNGKISMDTQHHLARPALLLLNGILYIAQDTQSHGWILAYNAQTLTQTAAFASTPNGTLGGIWHSGGGLVGDNQGDIYAATGDGTFDASTGGTDYGDTLMQLNSNLVVTDYFTPMDQACRFQQDKDLASGGPLALPTQGGSFPNEILIAGKGGSPCDASATSPIYLVNRDQMGGYNPNQDQVVEEISGATIGYWSSPAYWQGASSAYVYYAGQTRNHAVGDYLKAYSVSNGQISKTPVAQSSNTFLVGATPSVSANNKTSGIVWIVARNDYLDTRPGVKPGVLYAYDATNVASQLYSSAQSLQYGTRDQLGCATKFQVPTIANGKVYVGTENEVDIYGLLGQPLPAYPVSLSVPCATFGSVPVGSTGTAQKVTLKNVGSANLNFSSIKLAGSNPGDFTRSSTCMSPLAPGASCTITINFKPTATGPRFAFVLITDSALTSQSIYVIGSGT